MKPTKGLIAVITVVALLEVHPTSATAADSFILSSTQVAASVPFSRTLALDGSSYVVTQHHPELNVGGGSLTIEAWVNIQGLTLDDPSEGLDSFGYVVYKPEAYALGIGQIGQYWYLGFDAAFGSTWTIAGGNGMWLDAPGWHHIAVVFNQEEEWEEFSVDGHVVSHGTSDPWSPLVDSANTLDVGKGIVGEIDEIRISKTARYKVGGIGDFPVPNAPFSCDSQTCTLWHFDESAAATIFHDACGTDNALAPIWKLYLPIIGYTRKG